MREELLDWSPSKTFLSFQFGSVQQTKLANTR